MTELDKIYHDKIKALNEIVWSNKITYKVVNNWLNNYQEKDRTGFLYLLTHFIYFNDILVNKLIESLYRDLFRYKLLKRIRLDNNNTLDGKLIESEFTSMLKKTRFVTIGSANSSSSMLLYYLGNCNGIDKLDIFVNQKMVLNEPEDTEFFVFIDDLCSSATQVQSRLKATVIQIREKFPKAELFYYTLLSTQEGFENVEGLDFFDDIGSVLHLGETFKCFNDNSRILKNIDKEIDINEIQKVSELAGKKFFTYKYINESIEYDVAVRLAERDKLGYKNGQLLVGFYYNTPDNTVPIFWMNDNSWTPIFKRIK